MNSGLSLAHERVPDLCRELGLSNEVREQAVAYAKRADYEHPINRSADVVAAGCVYFVALLHNEKRTQDEVARAAGVTPVSIRNAYKELGEAEGFQIGGNRERRDTSDDETTERELLDRLRGWVSR